MGRDNSRNKGRGGGRGSGKKMMIANVDELHIREREVSEFRQAQARRRGDDDDEDEEGNNNNKVSDGEAQKGESSVFSFERKSRAEVAAEKAAKNKGNAGEADSEEEDTKPKGLLAGLAAKHNPNRAMKPTEKMIKVKDINKIEGPVDEEAGMTRKDKEALAAHKAKEDYQRRHMAGETEEARRQLADLAIVRQRREAARIQREAAGRAPGWDGAKDDDDSSSDESSNEDSDESDTGKRNKDAHKQAVKSEKNAAAAVVEKKKKAAAGTDEKEKKTEGSELEKLKTMDIKKMNGDQLKEKLKERQLNVQGAKKDLIKRLCDYEAAR